MNGKEIKHVTVFKKSKAKPGEEVRCFLEGWIGDVMGQGDSARKDGALIITNRRVVFYRKVFFGEIFETISIDKVTSVETSSFMGYKVITIHTSHDELKFKTFEDQKLFESAYDAIEAGRSAPASPSAAEPQPASLAGDDVEARLKKLGQLRDGGYITDAEFQEKRAAILAAL